MKINMREFKIWIRALDSGEYDQTKDMLQDKRGYCCLGLGCKVLIPKKKLTMRDGIIEGGLPAIQRAAPDWLKKIDDDFLIKTQTSLQWLNDRDGFTFPEIATMLELVYIHKAFD